MILTVTPNPAVDETYALDHLAVGGTNRVDAPICRAGGKGLNVARVLHSQGVGVHAVTTRGGASGDMFAAELIEAGIAHTLVPVAAPTRRSFALVDHANGLTTIVNEQGGGLDRAEWRDLRAAVAAAAGPADVVVGSGSLPGGLAADTTFYPWLVATAHAAGAPCIIDTSGPGLLAAADAGADLLKPNHHELLEATGATDIASGAGHLLERGARRVVVSSGEDGLALFDADRPGRWDSARLPEPLTGNPTGAGDACVAALALALQNGETAPAEILRRAAAWSASAVLMPTAGALHPGHPELASQLVIDRHHTPSAPEGSTPPCP